MEANLSRQLIKGEKININTINNQANYYTFNVQYNCSQNFNYDIDTFVLMSEKDNTINKNGIIYFNNNYSQCKGILYNKAYNDVFAVDTFELDLNQISGNVEKLIFVCLAYKDSVLAARDKYPLSIKLSAISKSSGVEIFDAPIETDIVKDKTILMGEIYKHNDTWKYYAIKQVFQDELKSMISNVYKANII